MGVIYKLKPEVINFILEEKKTNPGLSCRGISGLVEKEFQQKISKSSINSIIKAQGLSMPIGRRQKKRRRKPEPIILPEPPIVPQHIEPQPVTPIPPVEPPKPTPPEEITPPPKPLIVPEPPVAPMPAPPAPLPEIEVPVVEIQRQFLQEIECLGVVMLTAADYLLGGSYYFSEALKSRLNIKGTNWLVKAENLMYNLFKEHSKEGESLSEEMITYLNDLQSVRPISLDLFRIASRALQQVRCVKVNLSDGSILYFDGQLHTIWSTPHIPNDFCTTVCNIKSYINKYFYGKTPFAFLMAPGYDIPTKDFFNFILSSDSSTKRISQLTLYDNEFKELEVLKLDQKQKQSFAFGMWPWQFVEYRKVKKIDEFKPLHIDLLNKDIYAANIEIEFLQPNDSHSVTLKGKALKLSLTEKARLIVLSNLADEAEGPCDWLNSYLSHWPNFEEAFQDYSRKIELFTYTGSSREFLSPDMLNLSQEPPADIKTIFNNYLEALDLYIKWHFLPAGNENKNFSTIKEQFYGLPAVLKKENNSILVKFQPPQDFKFSKDLEYACRRLNEREVFAAGNIRLWFGP